MSGRVRCEVTDRVAVLIIDRPEQRNAVTTPMWQDLLRHTRWIADTAAVAAVVLRGAAGSFSAGADLTEVRDPDHGRVERFRALGETAVAALADLAPPTVAQIEGPCIGAGTSLALACDLRICSPGSLFAVPALAGGIVYEPAHVERLVRAVGPGSAGLLLLGGERWDGTGAAARGLADHVADDPGAAVERVLTHLRGAQETITTATVSAIRSAARST